MRFSTPILSLFAILLSVSACKVAEQSPDFIFTGEPEFTVDLYAERAADDGSERLGFWVESTKDFPAQGYGIAHSISLNGRQLTVIINGIVAPDSLQGLAAPARGFIPLPALADGEYSVDFKLADAVTNQGSLQIASGVFTLKMPDPQGLIFDQRILLHIPDGTIWGIAHTPEEPQQPIAMQFIQALKGITSENNLPPGFYGYFTVTGTGDFYFHKSVAPAHDATYFLRRRSAPLQSLDQLLVTYRSAQAPIDIRCWTTEGER